MKDQDLALPHALGWIEPHVSVRVLEPIYTKFDEVVPVGLLGRIESVSPAAKAIRMETQPDLVHLTLSFTSAQAATAIVNISAQDLLAPGRFEILWPWLFSSYPDFELFPVAAPPMLEEAIRYSGISDFVAFFWEPSGDEACFSDGMTTLCGAGHWGYLGFVNHPSVYLLIFTKGYDFGSSEESARHWLLLERKTRRLWVGNRGRVEQFLRANALRHHLDQMLVIPSDLTSEQFIEIVERRFQNSEPSIQEIQAAIEREAQTVQQLRIWLDTKL